MYCAVLTNQKVSREEANVLYKALDLIRLYERERPFLQDDAIDHIDSTYESIKKQISFGKIRRLPKLTDWMEDLLDTYL